MLELTERLAEGFLLADPNPVVIVDAALLYEAGFADRFRKIIVAWCRPEQQVERLMARMRLTREPFWMDLSRQGMRVAVISRTSRPHSASPLKCPPKKSAAAPTI